jgi:hypothetical protein
MSENKLLVLLNPKFDKICNFFKLNLTNTEGVITALIYKTPKPPFLLIWVNHSN